MHSDPNPPEVVTQGEGLRPCPFCGGVAKYIPHYWYEGTSAGDYVICTGCTARNQSRRLVSEPKPIAAWNTRHTPDREAIAQYAAVTLHELSEAQKEIAMLRDIVVTYGDKLRMGTVHRMDWQQAIDRAFDREN